METPKYSKKFEVPTNRNIDFKLIFGSCIFGLGWGMAGKLIYKNLLF